MKTKLPQATVEEIANKATDTQKFKLIELTENFKDPYYYFPDFRI